MVLFTERSERARELQMSGARGAAAIGEVGCVLGRVPGGFWDANIILLLDVGEDYTGGCSVQ